MITGGREKIHKHWAETIDGIEGKPKTYTWYLVILFSGPMVPSSLDHGALRSRIGYTSTAVRYCCTAVAHGGWVVRLVGVSQCLWVGTLLVIASVRVR